MGISAMNSIISNNRKLLKNGKRVPFTKMDGRSSKKQGYELYVMPWVFPHVLRRVRIKVKRENKRLFLKKNNYRNYCRPSYVILVLWHPIWINRIKFQYLNTKFQN